MSGKKHIQENNNEKDLLSHLYWGDEEEFFLDDPEPDFNELMLSEEFNSQSQRVLKNIINSFDTEDKFITKYRTVCAVFILIIVGISFIGLIAVIVLKILRILDSVEFISSLAVLLAEIFGLLAILFKYLFNRSENKIVDALIQYLEVKSHHEEHCDTHNNKFIDNK